MWHHWLSRLCGPGTKQAELAAPALVGRALGRSSGPGQLSLLVVADSAGATLQVNLLDLSRFCAAPLITYCAAKGMNHGHRQDG